MHRPVMYVGPTLPVGSPLHQEVHALFDVREPVRRGDVRELIARREPGLLVIVDGRFQQTLAVGHAELRSALQGGWDVWGLSSMGAIRAYEMRDLGLRGFGTVYECFTSTSDFQDDEVAMLHSPEAPFSLVSEPLVHIRHYVGELIAEGALDAAGAHAVIARLKGRWFGDRTLAALHDLLVEAGVDGSRVRRDSSDFAAFRIKTHDLQRFVSMKPWLRADPAS